MSRIYIFAALFLGFYLTTPGQSRPPLTDPDQPLRIEIPAQSDAETYRIIPCGAAGMVLFYKSTETTSGNAVRWYFVYHDKTLERIWVKSAPVLAWLDFKKALAERDTLCFFFEADKKNRETEVNFQILRISLKSGAFIINNGNIPGFYQMATFNVTRQKAVIGLNNDGESPSLMIMDLPTGQSSVLPLPSGSPSAILFGTTDHATGEISFLVSRTVSKRTADLWMLQFRSDGTPVAETGISGFDAGRSFGKVTLAPSSGNEILVAGVYTTATGKKSKANESSGLFAAPVIGNLQTRAGFFNFLDMKNIRQLLSERDILSLRKKSMKKSQADHEYTLDFSLLLHDIVSLDDRFILAAESYYPQYHSESFTDYDFYGRPFTNSYTVFDGYRFTGMIIAAFTKDGKLIWDNAMSIRDLISPDLDPKVTLYPSGNEIVLAYLSEGKIASRIISGPEIVEKTIYSDLELMTANDKLLTETRSAIVHWYDNYFLCYGYQEIRDISKGTDDKRMVFFCNKLMFDR